MKKVFLAVLVVLALAGSFLAGASLGARDVIENQIVSSEDHKQGFYEVEYNGQLYRYCYEK